MADHLIDLVFKPINVSNKTNRFFFLNFNNPIPDPNPQPKLYKNCIKVKKYKKKSLMNFKNKKSSDGIRTPANSLFEIARLDD